MESLAFRRPVRETLESLAFRRPAGQALEGLAFRHPARRALESLAFKCPAFGPVPFGIVWDCLMLRPKPRPVPLRIPFGIVWDCLMLRPKPRPVPLRIPFGIVWDCLMLRPRLRLVPLHIPFGIVWDCLMLRFEFACPSSMVPAILDIGFQKFINLRFCRWAAGQMAGKLFRAIPDAQRSSHAAISLADAHFFL